MKKDQKNHLSVGFLYDDTLDSNDGVAQYVKTLGAWLSAQHHNVIYLAGQTKMRQWSGGKVYSLAANKSVTFNGNRLSMPVAANGNAIKTALSENQLDILHVQMPYSPLMAKKVINTVGASTAVVGTFHVYPAGFWVRAGSYLLRGALGRSLRRFQAVISVSQPAAVFARRAFGIKSIVLPNVIEVASFAAAKDNHRQKTARIVFLGRLVERKGCRQMLEAFRRLIEAGVDVELVMAGDGPLRGKLESSVKKYGLERKVTLSGYVAEKDKPHLLAGADIACFPSLYGESFGIVLLEAMAAGAGVVLAGDNPGYRSVLGSQADMLVDPRDVEVFATRLAELLVDGARRRRLHAWQTQEVKKYDVERVGPQIVTLYRQAIARASKSRHN